MKVLSIRDSINQGLDLTTQHFGFLVKAALAYFFVGLGLALVIISSIMFFLSNIFASMSQETIINLDMIALIKLIWQQANVVLFLVVFGFNFLLAGFASSYMALGWSRAMLDLYDHGRSSLAKLFPSLSLGLRAYGFSLLFGLGATFFLCLLIVPGIIFMLMFGFGLFVLADRNGGIIESFKISREVTFGARWQLFKLALLVIIILNLISWILPLFKLAGLPLFLTFLIGLAAIIVGWFLKLTAIMIAVVAYRKLLAQTNLPVAAQRY